MTFVRVSLFIITINEFSGFLFSACGSVYRNVLRTWWLSGEGSMKLLNFKKAFCCQLRQPWKLNKLILFIFVILRFMLDVSHDLLFIAVSLRWCYCCFVSMLEDLYRNSVQVMHWLTVIVLVLVWDHVMRAVHLFMSACDMNIFALLFSVVRRGKFSGLCVPSQEGRWTSLYLWSRSVQMRGRCWWEVCRSEIAHSWYIRRWLVQVLAFGDQEQSITVWRWPGVVWPHEHDLFPIAGDEG